MKLQQFAKLVSKNVTVLSIASAFVLGAVGMTDIKDNLFDTSTWFMNSESDETEFENVAEDPNRSAFEFAKPTNTSEEDFEITEPEESSAPSEEETASEITASSEQESESTVPSEIELNLQDFTIPEMDLPTETTPETTESTTEETTTEAEPSESTKKTKKTKATEDTTKAPAEDTTAAPNETTAAPNETTAAPKETTAAPKETTAAPTEPAKKPLGDTSGSYNDGLAKEILTLVNNERVANGLAPLSWNGRLAKGAKSRATEIVVKWSHTRPDGSEWYNAPDCDTSYGENLAKGYSSTSSAMTGWMNSEGHRANILKAEYKTLGVACYVCNGEYYWVQEFGY